MYEWLPGALQDSSAVVTANRRLARLLRQEFSAQQVQSGKLAWPSPAIFSWQGWLETFVANAADPENLPTRINQQQSRVLWEQSLRRALPEAHPRMGALVRLSRDTWQRLADWRVGIRDVARTADNPDQRLFAEAAGRYLAILERNSWVDTAGLAALAAELVASGRIAIEGRLTLVGFDREKPAVNGLVDALSERGQPVSFQAAPERRDSIVLQSYATVEAEMRAAGAWARTKIEQGADARIAIVAVNLEQQALQKAHRIREGFAPGWQYGPPSLREFLNVSYGRRLTDYPAVSVALLVLRWLTDDLAAADVGHLLRTPLIGPSDCASRCRMELRLRMLPDRPWAPAMLLAAMRSFNDDAQAAAWLQLVSLIAEQRKTLPSTASPANWAEMIDSTLESVGWPGRAALASADYQLLNCWRELLNDLARLDLVSPAMSFPAAVRQLAAMAAETVFQPESNTESVQLMGPLEASGAEFDAIWISGMTASSWPPPASPSPLLSRRLQRKFGMPDAAPSDTVAFARTVLERLAGSAKEVVCSYALSEDDAAQTSSDLLLGLAPERQPGRPDPGWHAAALAGIRRTVLAEDAVPTVTADERVAGGATTIQLQTADPVSAFIVGRLGVKALQPQAEGLPALLRGNIIHDALCRLYEDKPDRNAIAAWSEAEAAARIDRAVESVFARYRRHAAVTLGALLSLESRRVADLLLQLVKLDIERDEFSILETEQEIRFTEERVNLALRADRIDRFADGTLAVLDYKTGARKRFLGGDGQPLEIQLVAYACALQETVSALALVNIDSRDVSFDGAGRGYTDEASWHDELRQWQQSVRTACAELGRGDVRVDRYQSIADARPFNLLSRFTELRRDG